MGYRSAINIFLVVLPPKKHLFDKVTGDKVTGDRFVSRLKSSFLVEI